MILFPVPERGGHGVFWTTGLVLINVLVFGVSWPMEKHRASAVSRDVWRQSAQDLQTLVQPDKASFSPDIQQALDSSPSSETYPDGNLLQAFRQIQTQTHSLSGPVRYEWDQTYPHFESLTASIASSREGSSPFRLLGFRPALGWFPGVLTHQFLHAGWWHLIGNMLFLWVVCGVLEYALGGRVLFLYLIGGVAAAWAQAYFGKFSPTVIMVGASGSISALMGFALLAVPSARVKLFYATLGKGGTFHAPLWFFLPLWLFDQLIQAGMAAGSEAVKVGYAAHIGGFVFGAGLAFFLRAIFRVQFQTPTNSNAAW